MGWLFFRRNIIVFVLSWGWCVARFATAVAEFALAEGFYYLEEYVSLVFNIVLLNLSHCCFLLSSTFSLRPYIFPSNMLLHLNIRLLTFW